MKNKISNCGNKEILQGLKLEAKELKVDLNDYFIQQEVKLEFKKLNPINFYPKTLQSKKLEINKFTRFTQEGELKKKFLGKNNTITDLTNDENINDFSEKNNLLGNKRRNNDIINILTQTPKEKETNQEGNINTNQNSNLSQGRSRRNISMKLDKDFLYDKDFLKKIGCLKNKNSDIKNTVINLDLPINLDDEEKTIEKKENILVEKNILKNQSEENKTFSMINLSHEETSKNLEDALNQQTSKSENLFIEQPLNSYNKSEELILSDNSEDNQTNSNQNKSDVENIKKMISDGLKNPNINQYLDPLKESIRKNSILQIQFALKENKIIFESGEEKIDKLSHELEKNLKIQNPLVNEFYTKAFNSMIKTIRELNKFKNVSKLIAKDKLNICKVAMFPYGNRLLEKLNKINNSAEKKFFDKNKNTEKNFLENKIKQNIFSNKTNPSKNLEYSTKKENEKNLKKNFPLKNDNFSVLNPTFEGSLTNNSLKKNKNDQIDFISLMSEMNAFYDSLNNSDALRTKIIDKNNPEISKNSEYLVNKGNSANSSVGYINSSQITTEDLNLHDDEDDSLKSECYLDIIRFSPGNNNIENKPESLFIDENKTENNTNIISGEDSKIITDNFLNISKISCENNNNFSVTNSEYLKSKSNMNPLQQGNINTCSVMDFNYSGNNVNKYISPFDKLYNPFDTEDEEEENKKSIDGKIKKKNFFLPLFYNPLRIIENNPKDVNVSNNSLTANYLNNYLNNSLGEKTKKIYEIWNGNLQTSKFDFPVKFMSTYPPEIFETISELPQNFGLNSKTVTKDVINYIEKNIIKDEKIIIFGWVEVTQEKYLVFIFFSFLLNKIFLN